MSKKLTLYDAEGIYKACKQFVETYEFGKQCDNRKGMYQFLDGIELDLASDLDRIIKEIGLNGCPFKED